MFSVKSSTSKRSWLVYNPSLTTSKETLNVKTTYVKVSAFKNNQEFIAEKMKELKYSDF